MWVFKNPKSAYHLGNKKQTSNTCAYWYIYQEEFKDNSIKIYYSTQKGKNKRFHVLQGSGKYYATHEIFTCIAVQQQRLICITHRKTGNVKF